MVIFQNPDGDPGYNQFESVEEAVSFVEKIRNDQGIDSIRIFELNEVKFELKPYYKVELQALNAGTAPSRPQPAPAPAPSSTFPTAAPAPAAPSTPAAPAPAAAAAPTAPAAESTSPFANAAPESPSFDPAPSQAPAPAPVPPADQPAEESQPTRRGLFGR
ncbi:MAG: hypothetical protein ACYC2O_01455 [Microthrixaceae bacterium]